jgi:hypothetical protein
VQFDGNSVGENSRVTKQQGSHLHALNHHVHQGGLLVAAAHQVGLLGHVPVVQQPRTQCRQQRYIEQYVANPQVAGDMCCMSGCSAVLCQRGWGNSRARRDVLVLVCVKQSCMMHLDAK